MSKVDSFHSYMQATKDMAQSVVHRYHTCDEEPDVAWEIIEDIMEGLIAVFLDMFGEEENPIHKNLTESDMERDIDSLEERVDEFEKRVERFRYETIEKIRALEKKIEDLERTNHSIIMADDHLARAVVGTWTNPDTLSPDYTTASNTEDIKR